MTGGLLHAMRAAGFGLLAALFLSCSPRPEAGMTYEHVLASLRPGLGCGTETTGEPEVHQPMAYGLIAWAAANRGDRTLACAAADWLAENADPAAPGWGLGWAWDAYGDGSTNPAGTVYGITTALAVAGLTSTYQLTNDKRYLKAARKALDYYVRFQCPRTGHLFYSDQAADAYPTPNVTAMLMGQYARLGRLTDCRRYQEVAARAYEALKRDAVWDGDALMWKYACGLPKERENDLKHASYIVYGLNTYERHAASHDSLAEPAARYLRRFIADDIYEFARGGESVNQAVKARSWGVGMLLYTLSVLGDAECFETVLSFLPRYEFENMRFSFSRGDERHCPRTVAHVLLGLSLYRDGKVSRRER